MTELVFDGMTEDEAATIVEPFSHLIAKSSINKKHGRETIEVLAFAPAILAIIAWTDRISKFRAQFEIQGATVVRTQSPETSGGPSEAPSGIPFANFGGITDPNQAPTARVNGDRAHLDDEDRTVTA